VFAEALSLQLVLQSPPRPPCTCIRERFCPPRLLVVCACQLNLAQDLMQTQHKQDGDWWSLVGRTTRLLLPVAAPERPLTAAFQPVQATIHSLSRVRQAWFGKARRVSLSILTQPRESCNFPLTWGEPVLYGTVIEARAVVASAYPCDPLLRSLRMMERRQRA
jgi:hypothetical protein